MGFGFVVSNGSLKILINFNKWNK